MSRWTGIATWRGPTPNQGGQMVEVRGLVVHIAQGTFEGTISWCKNPTSNVSTHFVAGAAGQLAQMIDTDVTAWTQRAGNGHWLSVENEGFTPNPLTLAQVEDNARLLAQAHLVYGVPLKLAASPTDKGLAYHSLGAEHGVDWGHSQCPGPAIKAQLPAILARAVEIVGGVPAPHPTLHRPWPGYMPRGHYFGLYNGPDASHGGWYNIERPDVKAIQQRLIVLGYVSGVTNPNSGWADGLYEWATFEAVRRWQRDRYANLTSFYGQVWRDDWTRLFTY